jgi:arginyl-tRNA--protein-N-Asp/Glu arginylyltransferase
MPEQQKKIDTAETEYAEGIWLLKRFTGHKDKQAIKYLLANENGRWYLNRIMESCQIDSTSFLDAEKTNTMLIFEGKRKVAAWLYKMICKCNLKGWYKAQEEYRNWIDQIKLLAADDAEKNVTEEQYYE